METAIFSTAYLPSVSYFASLVSHPAILIEKHEHYVKQSYRNRCHIASANGLQALTVPIVHDKQNKIVISDVCISYELNWQKIHWKTIESAYNKSPFFEFYKDLFVPFYENKKKFLFDLNLELMELILKLLSIKKTIQFTDTYEENYPVSISDLRNSIHPKPLKNKANREFIAEEYTQVFSDRNKFIADLSIIDLLFCQGPEASHYL